MAAPAMLIVADENIPFVREVFSRLGEVRTLPGRRLVPRELRDAEMLLVRSVTRIDEAFLEGSRVRFVGSATIGTDHVDLDALRARGIAFAAAPGSNAQSVAEYVCAALLVLEERGALSLSGARIGVIGVGNVGSRVVKVALALGMTPLVHDPPLERSEGVRALGALGPGAPREFVPLREILESSDVVTLHVPLERSGPYPTWHMVDERFLDALKRGAVLLNTSRGAVADGEALARYARSGRLGPLVLDVWENEPRLDPGLVELAALATPHIAGYSFDGKLAGTRMIYEAACAFLGVRPEWPAGLVPQEELVTRLERPRALDAVRVSYDIEADDRRLRECMRAGSEDERAALFDRLRRDYPVRREFARWSVELGPDALPVGPVLGALGFRVVERGAGDGGAARSPQDVPARTC